MEKIIKPVNLSLWKIKSSTWVAVIVSLLVGSLAGLFAVVFRVMIGWSSKGYTATASSLFHFLPGNTWKIFIPALAGLVVGPLVYFFAREAKGHGVPEVMESVALKGGKMRMRVIFIKAIASASSIGSGASVGREGPIVQMGSGIGSIVARFFKMRKEKVRTCVACGAAAGIAATFNAPIAGVIFALEVILGQFGSSAFILIVISAVTASVVAQIFVGDIPAFVVHGYSLNHPLELIFYAFLGVLSAIVAYLFIKVLYKSEDLIDRWKIIPDWFKPVIGGVVIGAIGLLFPQVLGVGYETMETIFREEMLLGTLIALVFIKILATSITLGSGHSGGVFAPSLFMGAALGGAFGLIIQALFPTIAGSPGAYAIIGMGALVAGTTQAPITAVLIIFEMTRDYHIILPLMIAVVFSTLISSILSEETIYTIKLLRRGIKLKAGKDINIMKQIKVKDVMTKSVEVCSQDTKVGKVIDMMHHSKHNGFPVLNERTEIVGIITLQDIREAPVEGIMDQFVSNLMSDKLIVTYPEDTLEDVFHKFSQYDIGHLPVVIDEQSKQIAGLITRSDIVKAYDKQLFVKDEIIKKATS